MDTIVVETYRLQVYHAISVCCIDLASLAWIIDTGRNYMVGIDSPSIYCASHMQSQDHVATSAFQT